ncbi:aspartyl/asparaginyl beta-hydroxylase domain-containing protein [Indioceanicola profundi]|uniref:aspartyl/asparaginyl beta-hydroxylase domain-containing protein n=1 Tax=Indioceanicola profundi TaxID=2220096 RepID=UPI000E6AC266|nr:aspartyl/asparaginyl beta-hydroxylase domain-containing protein [Indioceanicola profundi]
MTEPVGDGVQAGLLPWQALTAACDFPLAAPLDARLDPDALARDLAEVERQVGPEGRTRVPHMTGWCSIPVVAQDRPGNVSGTARAALAFMPIMRDFLHRTGLCVTRADLIRSEPGWVLDWHYDPLAPHRAEARLLLPLRTGPGARTWMSHEEHHWDVGSCWAADFTFPHMMTNDGFERVILALDIQVDDAARALLPPALMRDGTARIETAQKACNMMLAARHGRQPAASA